LISTAVPGLTFCCVVHLRPTSERWTQNRLDLSMSSVTRMPRTDPFSSGSAAWPSMTSWKSGTKRLSSAKGGSSARARQPDRRGTAVVSSKRAQVVKRSSFPSRVRRGRMTPAWPRTSRAPFRTPPGFLSGRRSPSRLLRLSALPPPPAHLDVVQPRKLRLDDDLRLPPEIDPPAVPSAPERPLPVRPRTPLARAPLHRLKPRNFRLDLQATAHGGI